MYTSEAEAKKWYDEANEVQFRYKDELIKRLEVIDAERKETHNSFLATLPDTLIRCESCSNGSGCGAVMTVSECIYVQSHGYTEPHGCSGGDYWTQDDGEFICPKCNLLNRLYYRKQYEALKPYFARRKNTHLKGGIDYTGRDHVWD